MVRVTVLVRAVIIAFVLANAAVADAQPSETSRLHWVTNGTVTASAVHEQTLYIGGTFTRVAPAANFLGPWFSVSTATGVPGPRLPLADGAVLAIEPDGAGGYFVGGRFQRIGGVERPALAHVRADGTIDPGFAPLLQPMTEPMSMLRRLDVRTLARTGSTLYVGGAFQMAAGVETQIGAVALDTSSGALLPWRVDSQVVVQKVLPDGDTVYVLGNTPVNPATVFARDATSGALRWQRQLGGGVPHSAIRAGSRLVVVGSFYGGSPPGLSLAASLDPATGVIDPNWSPHVQNSVGTKAIHAVAVSGSTLYVGGTFDELGGAARRNLAAIDLATGTLTAWAPDIDGPVHDVKVSPGGTLWIAGAFRHAGGLNREALAELAADGTPTAWSGAAYSADVRTLHLAGGTLLAGGSSAVAGGVARHQLAAFRLDLDEVTPWTPAGPAGIEEIAAGAGRVFVGGRHPATYRAYVTAYEADGSAAPWQPPVADIVSLLGVVDAHVYLSLNTALIPSIVRVGAEDGAIDSTWRLASSAFGMVSDRDVIYLLGATRANGEVRNGLAAVDARSAALRDWSPSPVEAPRVGTLAQATTASVSGRTIFASFRDWAQPYHHLAAFDTESGLRVHFPVSFESHVLSLAAVDDMVVTMRGAFDWRRGSVAAFRLDGSAAPWDAGLALTDALESTDERPRVFATGTDMIVTGVQSLLPEPVHGVAVFARAEPTGPAALDATAVDHAVRLAWRSGTPAPAGHVLEVGSRPGASDLLVQVTGPSPGLDAVAPFGTYYVRVRRHDGSSAGAASNEIALRVGCAGPPAWAPGRLALHVAGTHVRVDWEPPPFMAVSRYVLEAGSEHSAANLARLVLPGTSSSFETDAPPGVYFVRMRAENLCGIGPPTPEARLTVGAGELPAAPSGLQVSAVGPAFPSPLYVAEWQPVAGATGYILEAGTQPGLANLAVLATPEPRLGPAAVAFGRAYYVRVRAVNAAGVGPPGAEFLLLAQ